MDVPAEQLRSTAAMLHESAEELAVRVRYLSSLTAALQDDWRGPAADAFMFECQQGLDAMGLVLELPRAMSRRLEYLADRFSPR